MKFLSIVLIASLVALSQQKRNKPQSGNWGPGSWDAAPAPQTNCNCPPGVVEEAFTPFVDVNVTFDQTFICSSGSAIKQLSYQAPLEQNVTCNGVVIVTRDDIYNATIGGGYGGKSTIALNLINYTVTYTFSNGNILVQECATITGGKCSGDTLIGSHILEANDQNGCCGGGVTSATGLFAQFQIKGKCASSCSLGSEVYTYSQPICNHGSGDRSNNA